MPNPFVLNSKTNRALQIWLILSLVHRRMVSERSAIDCWVFADHITIDPPLTPGAEIRYLLFYHQQIGKTDLSLTRLQFYS